MSLIKVFISFSTVHTPGEPRTKAVQWAHRFKDEVCRLSGYSAEEVYLYTDPLNSPIGAQLREEIPEYLGATEHLICLLSDEFLESVWCCDEYWRFVSRTETNRTPPIFVITPFLHGESRGRRDRLATQVHRGIEKMNKSRDPLFVDELEQFVNSHWADDIVGTRKIDLSQDDWTDAVERFPKLLAPPRSRFVLDYAGLSAYCLGADRYLSGGWGFSLTNNNTFCYDREDGEELPNGPYGLSVVVLRALSKFLGEKRFKSERLAVFPLKLAKRNPVHAVTDRLPHFAGLLSCLEHVDWTSMVLSKHADKAVETLTGVDPAKTVDTLNGHADDTKDRFPVDPQSRWTLAHVDVISPSEEYHASVFACLDLARELSEDEEGKSVLAKPLYDDKKLFESFQALCTTAIAQNDLLKMLLGDNRKIDRTEMPRASMIWLLLAGCPKGRELLSAHINGKVESIKERTRLLERICDGIDKADADSLTLSLTLFACVLCCRKVDKEFAEKLINNFYALLFNRSESYQIVPKLNAIAWASIIIIATKEAEKILDRKELARLWEDGLSLRQKRLEYVKELSQVPGQLSKENLDGWRRQFVRGQVKKWIEEVGTLNSRMERKSDEQCDAFSSALSGATFWGGEFDSSEAKTEKNRVLGGVLRVNCKSDRVEMDSEGYNQIFLRPFSQITGMNVVDLSGIRREFGGLDQKLVEIMAETVVQQTYVRRGEGYECKNCDFLQRTTEITGLLKDDRWNREEGLDDFLIVRRENDEQNVRPRLIHRSAIVQQPRRAGADPVISWRFLEMPSIMKSILPIPDETA